MKTYLTRSVKKSSITKGMALFMGVCAAGTLGIASQAMAGGGTPFEEDWDSYPSGQNMHGVGGWKGWDNDPQWTAFTSNAQALSVPNSIEIVGDADLVHEHDMTSGAWVYTVQQYIPSGFNGQSYFILLNLYNDGGAKNWSLQTTFDSGLGMVSETDGEIENTTDLPLIFDQWVELQITIDLNNDLFVATYNGQEYASGEWSQGGELAIGATDLFANGASEVYYDNITIEPGPGICDPDDVCPWDIQPSADGNVGTADLLALLGGWGTNGPGACIADPQDVSNTADLLGLLANWGECPIANDDCEDGTLPVEVGGPAVEANLADNDDDVVVNAGSCNGTFTAGEWFSVIGDGTTLTVTTCDKSDPFNDLGMLVLCEGCEGECVGTNLDGPGDCGLNAQVSFCSVNGAEYRVLVYQQGGTPGTVSVQATSNGVGCEATICLPPEGGCCLPDESCSIQTSADCADAGGFYLGDDSDCAGIDCGAIATYQYDSFTCTNSIGLTAGGDIVWMHGYDAEGGSDTINDILVAFGTGSVAGETATWAIYDSESAPFSEAPIASGDFTIDAGSIETCVPQVVPTGGVAVSDRFWIAVLYTHAEGAFPAELDESVAAPAESVYIAGGGAGTVDLSSLGSAGLPLSELGPLGFPGVWVLRAE